MPLNYISAQLKDAPRHASGPRCLCCNRPAAPDIDPEDYASWQDVVLGGFLHLTVCSICGKCPLAGPCRFDGDARDQARMASRIGACSNDGSNVCKEHGYPLPCRIGGGVKPE